MERERTNRADYSTTAQIKVRAGDRPQGGPSVAGNP